MKPGQLQSKGGQFSLSPDIFESGIRRPMPRRIEKRLEQCHRRVPPVALTRRPQPLPQSFKPRPIDCAVDPPQAPVATGRRSAGLTVNETIA